MVQVKQYSKVCSLVNDKNINTWGKWRKKFVLKNGNNSFVYRQQSYLCIDMLV